MMDSSKERLNSSLLLSLLSLLLVCVGGWYLMAQNMEQKQNNAEQAELIHQLSEKLLILEKLLIMVCNNENLVDRQITV